MALLPRGSYTPTIKKGRKVFFMWNNLDLEVLNAWSIKPEAYYLKIVFLIVKVIEESKLVTRLGFSPSHFCEHKSKHSFQDTVNSNCICGLDVELTSHDIFRCPIYHDERYTLLSRFDTKFDGNLTEITLKLFSWSIRKYTDYLLKHWLYLNYWKIWWIFNK